METAGLRAAGRGGRGRAARLPGNVRPRDLRGDARWRGRRRISTGGCLPGARVRGRLPADRARRALWPARIGGRKRCALAAHLDHLLRRCWKAQFTVSLPRLRPCAGEFAAARGAVGSRVHPASLRVARLLPASRARAFHARAGGFARCGAPARRDHDERRQPHRAGRLHRRRAAKTCTSPCANRARRRRKRRRGDEAI